MPNAAAKTFKDQLITAINNLKQLLSLLNEEKILLQNAQASPSDITEISQTKEKVLKAIEADIAARNSFLGSLNLSPDSEGIKNFFAKLPANLNAPLSKGWQQLTSVLTQVQEANALNGQLINRASQHYEMLINSVKATQSKVKVYNPKGASGNLNMPRNLGSA